MDNKTTGILAIVIVVALIGGYVAWENTRGADGETTLKDANPNAPAITEPAAPGGGPMKQTP
ncbi:hypothetical protein IZ6_12430 [Terrihabitans soli]|uniref:Uncharacterized protein n=1 Tax=Terrihabitans soli TaxID=708113 RepID=A0A6S6QVI0_9HYPH|nr:hypothetical protein [Terrihabitans soli]BCJ90508.1 hypothetical protein IZ6_12430 [Terrihabitans soli]